jgi:hypothetical protein
MERVHKGGFVKEPKKWLIGLGYGVLVVLLVHFYAQYRIADIAAANLLKLVQSQGDYINNQCVTLLGRQGFQVTKTVPPELDPEEEEKQ